VVFVSEMWNDTKVFLKLKIPVLYHYITFEIWNRVLNPSNIEVEDRCVTLTGRKLKYKKSMWLFAPTSRTTGLDTQRFFSVLAKLEADRKHNRRWQPNVNVLAVSILFVLQSQVYWLQSSDRKHNRCG